LKTDRLLASIAIAQALLGIRVIWRMIRTMGGERILPVEHNTVTNPVADRPSHYLARVALSSEAEKVSVIVPVLNEYMRLEPCLDGLVAQGEEVVEMIVVDGGSVDGTQELVSRYIRRNARICLVDASPIPPGWNGKAWGLQVGLRSTNAESNWILTLDADVRPKALLTLSLLEQAKKVKLSALSVATLQEVGSIGEGLLHPSLLTTLVYRFGIPGKVIHRVSEVQANGQCFLFRREALEACNGFQGVRNSVCEDITIARTLVASGYRIGFYEAGDLVSVKMYKDWRETWRNWPRSLPMHDHFSGIHTLVGLLEIVFVQALPLPLLFLVVTMHRRRNWMLILNSVLGAMRIGVLFGTMRSYRRRPWTYWLSPLCDLAVAIQLLRSALRRRHIWRGRVLVRGGIK
jgi:dolichol-phosphate mannosyltransferase